MPETGSIKAEARHPCGTPPDDAIWDDLLYQVCVRQSIEVGQKDCREGRAILVSEVRWRMAVGVIEVNSQI